MAARRAGDHSDDQAAGGAHRKGMHARRRTDESQFSQRKKGQADRNPCVGGVQDSQDWALARDQRLPIQEAAQMKGGGEAQRGRW